jgi:CRISPR-associated protein Csb2
MNSVLCLTIRFLDSVPQFHGRGSDGDPEWPPSPLRLFQALVAASASRWRENSFQECARPVLHWLETIEPSIVTPPVSAESFGYRMYVPNNSGDLMTAAWARGDTETSMAKFRVEKDVRPTRLCGGDAVHYLFPLAAGDGPDFHLICAAARSITHLGWGVDMAAGDARILSHQEAGSLSGVRWTPAPLGGTLLRAPTSGTLDALSAKHAAFLARLSTDVFRPVPPLTAFRVVRYRRHDEPLAGSYALFELRTGDDEFFRYPQNKFVHIAGMVRHLAIMATEHHRPPEVKEDWSDTYVAGHNRSNSDDHRQLSYVPLPSIGHPHADQDIRRVMIVGPTGDDRWIEFVARRLNGQFLEPEQHTRFNQSVMLVRVQRDNVARHYTQSSNAWASVTPVILPGHDDHKPAKTQKLIVAALAQSGIEQPCDFEWSAFSQFPKSLSAHKYGRDKRPTGYIRPDHLLSQTAVHLKLRFHDGLTVPGQLVIGAGRHCGFGLMAGVDR